MEEIKQTIQKLKEQLQEAQLNAKDCCVHVNRLELQ